MLRFEIKICLIDLPGCQVQIFYHGEDIAFIINVHKCHSSKKGKEKVKESGQTAGNQGKNGLKGRAQQLKNHKPRKITQPRC